MNHIVSHSAPSSARPRWLAVLYVACLGIGFWNGGLGMPWYLKYLLQLGIAGAALLFLLVTGDLRRLRSIGEYFLFSVLPLGAMAVWSALLWVLDLQEVRYMTRGASSLLYHVISLTFVCAAVYLFGRRAVDLTFYGMCLANLFVVLESIGGFGVQALRTGLWAFLRSGGVETNPAVKALEVHDLTFAFGLMLLYYLLCARGRRRVLHALPAALFFLLGFKRIALAGLAAGLGAALLLRKGTAHRRAHRLFRGAFATVLLCFGYVCFIRSGLFGRSTDALGIDTMGRVQLYEAFAEWYTFGPGFRGYGIGWVSRRISILTAQGTGIFAAHNFGGLHNDLVTLYIELGFWGFALWVLYSWPIRLRWCQKHYGLQAACLLFCCTLYLFVTYATDNTAFYCYTNTIFFLLPLAHALRPSDPSEVTHHDA